MSSRSPVRYLRRDLERAGRECRCEVHGCVRTDVSIHHVVPVAVRAIDDIDNLVYLCPDHHALVERFYWWERAKLHPAACKQLQQLARAFRARSVAPLELAAAKLQSDNLWYHLNHECPANVLWWKAMYSRAARWASHQQVLRFVHPENAITEDPWFRDRRGPALALQESEVVA